MRKVGKQSYVCFAQDQSNKNGKVAEASLRQFLCGNSVAAVSDAWRKGTEENAAIPRDEARSSTGAISARCVVAEKLPLTWRKFPANLMEMKVIRVLKGA